MKWSGKQKIMWIFFWEGKNVNLQVAEPVTWAFCEEPELTLKLRSRSYVYEKAPALARTGLRGRGAPDSFYWRAPMTKLMTSSFVKVNVFADSQGSRLFFR